MSKKKHEGDGKEYNSIDVSGKHITVVDLSADYVVRITTRYCIQDFSITLFV